MAWHCVSLPPSLLTQPNKNDARQLEWADTEIREIQHAIRNTEDTVEIQLDLLRNRILRFELLLNIVASVISFGCLVTGAWGFNLMFVMSRPSLCRRLV